MALLSDDDVFGASPSKELMSDDDVFGTSSAKPQNKGVIGDTVTDLKRGVEQLPGALTGLTDLVNPLTYLTGTRMADTAANWLGEKTGFQPSKWQEEAASEYSPERKASDEAISKAWEEGGAANIAGTIATNPRSILGVVGQSAPSMIAGGGAARLAMKGLASIGGTELAALTKAAQVEGAAGNAARETLNRMATTAGAIGEGAVTAGQNMDQVSRDVDPAKAAATSLAAGVVTGGIGKVSGRVANKLGLPDIETAMAGGGLQKSGLPWYKRIPSAAAQEGLLQEFPQSAQEQIWQNLAEDKPWYENALRQGVEGALAGGVMGGGAGLLAGRQESNPTEQPEPTTIAGLLPAPTSTGTPSEQVLQAEVARQNAVDAAQANADRIYAERDLYEETMKSVFPYGVPTITEPVAPIQQRIDELLGVERTKLKGLKRAQYQRELKKAYDEPVGITHDDNGLEIPLTMGDLLNSQAAVEITLREKRQQAIDNANAQAMARNDQVISEETTQQPDPIPVVGPLSAIANQAVKTGVAAQVQAQKAAAENPNGELTQNTADAQVATPSAQAQGSDVPGGGSILVPASTGVADSSGNSSEVAQPSLRADVATGGASQESLITQPQGTSDVPQAAQAVQAETQRPEQQPAAPVVRGYPQGQARMLAGRMTKQGFPTELYPHPTQPGMFALRPSGENNAESTPAGAPNTTQGETNGQEAASPAPALTAPVAPQRTIPPNQRRDDLVGAILRVTGGAGVASSMADTIVGEKANKVGKLRGLFTNAGQQDMGDIAMLLREQEGYDVRDGSHLEELIRAAASGDVPKSMARQEADAEAAKEKRYRDEIRAKAKKYGIKTVAGKFSELEKRVFETLEQRHKKALELLDAQSKERFNAALEAATATIPEEVVDETLAEVSRRGLHARDFWNEATRILRGMIYDATQETSNAEQPTENGNAQGDGRGDQGTGRGIAADQGDQAQPGQAETEEVAPTLELAGQTPAEVRAQEAKRKADEEAAKREEKPKTPNVTVDQVDLFNTQGGLFDGKQSESTAKNKDISTGFANVAQRQINAANNFIDSVVDQFGLTKDEAGRAWDYFVANKLVKVDSVGGQYMLSDGRLWDSVAMHRAANNGEDASTIDAAAHEAATSPLNNTPLPTEAQKQAANYKMGHVTLHGLDISIENPKGSVRSGVDADGKPWKNTLANHYGYIRGTEGNDGDHVDAFIGDNPESTKVFIVDQRNTKTGAFDEHKVLLGFNSLKEAKAGYAGSYQKGWMLKGVISVTPTTLDELKTWMANGDMSKPFSKESAPGENQNTIKKQSEVGNRDVKEPWKMTRKEWSAEREALKPNVAQSSFTKASSSEAVSRNERLQSLLYGVTSEASEKLRAAQNGEVKLSKDEVDSLLDRVNTPVAHQDVVEKALKEGKPVPSEVLADYPELTAERTAPSNNKGEPKSASEKIQDFGEKIGGARKDVWTSFKDSIKEVPDNEIANYPLSKSWPEPNYQALLDGGADPWAVAFMHAARDEVPRKPSASYKVKRWADQVQALREMTSDLVGGKHNKEFVQSEMRSGRLSKLASRIELYELVGHEKSLAGISFAQHHYSLYKGRENVNLWVVEKDSKSTAMSNWPSEIATADTKAELLDRFKAAYASLDSEKQKSKAVSFDLYIQESKFFVGKKMGRNITQLAGPFDSVKEARAYRNDNYDELVSRLERAKEIPKTRRESNEPRVGEDMRDGQDVTPQLFAESFGFKGVEFGNWVDQKKRQRDLNDAFDALMDMAAIMGIPPKALSLNGELGLAFGARGTGGIDAAAAHYERDYIAINLTKKEGAGSIGHEWWHALDNYFSRMRGKSLDDITEALDVSLSSKGSSYVLQGPVRKEMVDAFGRVIKAIRITAMRARSMKLDNKRSKAYWTTNPEMSARAFESYLISKLQDQNASNDYLANIVDAQTWKAAEALGFELEDSYPYPTAGEMPLIREAFDSFFQAVETRETDKGVALYSTSRQKIGDSGLGDATITQIQSLKPIADILSDENAVQVSVKGGNVDVLNNVARQFGKKIIFFRAVDAGRSEDGAMGAQPGRTGAAEAADGRGEGVSSKDYITNGFVNPGRPDLIFLNVDSSNHLLYIVGHELGHTLRIDSPMLWASMAKELQPLVRRWSEYKADMGRMSTNEVENAEELFGDVIGQNFLNEAFWDDLANENRSLFRKIADAAIKLINKAARLIVGKDVSIYISDMNKARSIIAKTMAQYSDPTQSLPNAANDGRISPADKAVYGMAAEGKSATEILKFIQASSRNPFYRQLAKLLQQTGINPTITVGDSKGWKFNAGDGKYSAAYNPATDTAALFRPAAAERNVLHELMHAATLKALAKKGMAAAQMRALFEHVKKSGKLRGQYGMSNVDEFVAEAFSNPKFQQALKKVKAPQGGTLQSAWHWFVRVVRGILGLKQGDESALSAALELGVGVMRENMGLNGSLKDDSVRGMADKYTVAGTQAPTSAGDGIERPIYVNPSLLEFREKQQNRKQELQADTDDFDPIVAIMDGGKLSIIDGHNRASVAIDRGDDVRVVVVTEQEYKWLKENGFDDMEIAWAALRRAGQSTAAGNIESQFPGSRISENADAAWDYLLSNEPSASAGSDAIRYASETGKVSQIDTPAFRKWFGGSKVVDAEGKPLVVYHGTARDFAEFDTSKGVEGGNKLGPGAYFTPSRERASSYAADYMGLNGSVMPVYLSIQNPYITSADHGPHYGQIGAKGQQQLRNEGFDGIIYKNGNGEIGEIVAFRPEQIKSAIGNNGNFDPSNPDIRYNVADDGLDIGKIVGDSGRDYDQRQRQFFKNVGRDVTPQNVVDRARDYLKNDFWKKMAVGVVDQFRGLRDLGDNGQAYMLARLSKGAAGAFETLLHHGKLSIKDGAYDGDQSGGFIEKLGVPLQGELDDFLWYVAANRAEGLAASDRENLFTQADIAAGKSLAGGMTSFDYTIQTGASKGSVTRSRAFIYADALRVFNEFQKNALDMAEQSGLIDGASRKFWESEFYVPFYRVSEEDGEFIGSKMGNSLVRQTAFKKLKGGTDKLNSDLLSNTLLNWSHLIEASAKNRAAKAALTAADAVGAAQRVAPDMASYTASNGSMLPPGTKKTVWFQENGKKVEYLVSDPFVMTAITSLEYAGMRNGVMDVMTKFKHWLTIGVTASPAFKVRNLIRDSVQAIGTSGLSYNPIKNIAEGYAQTKRDSQAYVSALASGGLIRFGTMLEGSESSRVRQLIRSGVKDSTILDSEPKWRQFYNKYLEPGVSAYNELGNRSEEINRAALYNQLIKQGKSHAEAALLARDLMDFSMQGSFNTIRFLTQVVPFMNARLQGLYKLGRSAKDNPRKMAVVTGAVALASIALMLGYDDDDDWKRREDWDRDNFWWFKFGGVEFRIPKPFEIGAVATLAERSVEFMINDEMTGERFRKVTKDLVMNNLSMNPVPQALKPIIDLYANKDSFTGRPIETMSMQRLDPTMRYGSNTSLVARGLSTATGGAASPVQYDHLVRAYFGWLGSFVIGGADMAARPFSNEPQKPEADYWKLATQGIAKEQGGGNSRYLTLVYDQASELEQAHATHRQMIKEGKIEEAQDYAEDNADKLKRYRVVESVKRAESKFNENIRAVERSDLDPAEKKLRIERIQKMKENIAKRIAPGIQGP